MVRETDREGVCSVVEAPGVGLRRIFSGSLADNECFFFLVLVSCHTVAGTKLVQPNVQYKDKSNMKRLVYCQLGVTV